MSDTSGEAIPRGVGESSGGELWNGEYLRHSKEMLWRQLNEVHLLLDHVSSLPEHTIDKVKIAVPSTDGKPTVELSGTELALRLAQIHFPPRNQADIALDSAILLAIKDQLAQDASPARSMTIAFTYMYLGEEPLDPGKSGKTKSDTKDKNCGDDDAKSRVGASRYAFPWLRGPVKKLRNTLRWLRRFMLILVIPAIALTSWDIYYAGGLLDDHAQYTRAYDGFFAANNDRPATCERPKTGDPAADAKAEARLAKICDDYVLLISKITSSYLNIDRFVNGELLPPWSAATNGGATRSSGLPEAVEFVRKYIWSPFKYVIHPIRWSFILWDVVVPICPTDGDECAASTPDEARQRAQAARLAGLVAVFKSYALPMLFGVLGAWVRILRQVEDHVTRFVLSPSDQFMVMSGMFSGVVAGLVVGLFYYGAGSTSQAVSVGGMGLSAGALSFVAGYGYDRFYKMLDALLVRIFEPTPPASGTPSSAALKDAVQKAVEEHAKNNPVERPTIGAGAVAESRDGIGQTGATGGTGATGQTN